MALLLVGIVSLAQTSKRRCACHAFFIVRAPPSRQRCRDPSTAPAALLRRGFFPPAARTAEARARLQHAPEKSSAAETKTRNRRGSAAAAAVADQRSSGGIEAGKDRQRRQQHDEFVEVGRQAFAQYFAYDLDDWQLEAGGAIASGHNVIVCGAFLHQQTTQSKHGLLLLIHPFLTVTFSFRV
jgi:hypothetical protein